MRRDYVFFNIENIVKQACKWSRCSKIHVLIITLHVHFTLKIFLRNKDSLCIDYYVHHLKEVHEIKHNLKTYSKDEESVWHQCQATALVLDTGVQVIHHLYERQMDYFIILWAVALKGTSNIK